METCARDSNTRSICLSRNPVGTTLLSTLGETEAKTGLQGAHSLSRRKAALVSMSAEPRLSNPLFMLL